MQNLEIEQREKQELEKKTKRRAKLKKWERARLEMLDDLENEFNDLIFSRPFILTDLGKMLAAYTEKKATQGQKVEISINNTFDTLTSFTGKINVFEPITPQ